MKRREYGTKKKGTLDKGRRNLGHPDELPCGCQIRSKQGKSVSTSAIVLGDGRRVCRHGKIWTFMPNRKNYVSFDTVPGL